jgi:hypothetical protein
MQETEALINNGDSSEGKGNGQGRGEKGQEIRSPAEM